MEEEGVGDRRETQQDKWKEDCRAERKMYKLEERRASEPRRKRGRRQKEIRIIFF